MTKLIILCDLCEREIDSKTEVYTVEMKRNGLSKDFDLCKECCDKITRQIYGRYDGSMD